MSKNIFSLRTLLISGVLSVLSAPSLADQCELDDVLSVMDEIASRTNEIGETIGTDMERLEVFGSKMEAAQKAFADKDFDSACTLFQEIKSEFIADSATSDIPSESHHPKLPQISNVEPK